MGRKLEFKTPTVVLYTNIILGPSTLRSLEVRIHRTPCSLSLSKIKVVQLLHRKGRYVQRP